MIGTVSVFLLCFLAVVAAPSGAKAGKFLVVVGDVQVIAVNGGARTAARGGSLEPGERVRTALGAFAQLRLADRGLLAVRGDSEFKLEGFKWAGPKDTKGQLALRLFRGALRSITGLIGRTNRQGYRLRTPHATIGIRGTDHETFVTLSKREGFAPGTFDIVYAGGTSLRTKLGTVDVSPKQAGYVNGVNLIPRIVKVPKFARAVAHPGAVSSSLGKGKGTRANTTSAGRGGDTKVSDRKSQQSTKRALINPLISPLSPTAKTTQTQSIRPTTVSPTLSRTVISPGLSVTPTTKTPLKTISPTAALSPTLTPLAPTTTRSLTTISPRITLAPTTTTKSLTTLSPTTTTTRTYTLQKPPTPTLSK